MINNFIKNCRKVVKYRKENSRDIEYILLIGNIFLDDEIQKMEMIIALDNYMKRNKHRLATNAEIEKEVQMIEDSFSEKARNWGYTRNKEHLNINMTLSRRSDFIRIIGGKT